VHATESVFVQQRENGLQASHGPLRTEGFPGRIVVTVPSVAIGAPVTNGGWTWRAESVAVSTWPWRWQTLDLDLAGTHQIAGLMTAPGVPLWIATPDADATVVLDGTGAARDVRVSSTQIAVSLDQAGATLLRLGSVAARVARLTPAEPPSSQSPTLPATGRVELDIREATLPPGLPVPLQPAFARAMLIAEVTGPWSSGLLPHVLEGWRQAGGTLEVREALLDWPPLRVTGSGTFALDNQLQPLGSFALKLQGGAEAIDTMVSGGAIGETEASIGRLALALLGRIGDSGAQELAMSLTVQNRQLTMGPLPLAEVPPITWPQISVP
jgi:hypothetical protein